MKLTEWFPGDVKPVRTGVYERNAGWVGKYSYWNGKTWNLGFTHMYQFEGSLDGVSTEQSMSWRGLASNPQKGKK